MPILARMASNCAVHSELTENSKTEELHEQKQIRRDGADWTDWHRRCTQDTRRREQAVQADALSQPDCVIDQGTSTDNRAESYQIWVDTPRTVINANKHLSSNLQAIFQLPTKKKYGKQASDEEREGWQKDRGMIETERERARKRDNCRLNGGK